MTCFLFDCIKNREVINYTSSCIQYTVSDYSCVWPPMTQLLGGHSNATPILAYKYEAILQLLCATLYSLVQCEENCTSTDSNATYRKSPLVVTTAVIPSQKCCLLGQVTLIHLHLSSMT